jgi:hypothetical protein
MLRYEHVALMHSPQNYAREFGRIIEAWHRQLPHLTCPLRFEEGRLFRRVAPEKRDQESKWEEDFSIQSERRWLSIPEILPTADFEALTTISAVVFMGVVGVKHRCRVPTEEEFEQAEVKLPIHEPTAFQFGKQRMNELLVEVMGA